MPYAIYVETPTEHSCFQQDLPSTVVELPLYSIRLCTAGSCQLLINQQPHHYSRGDFLVLYPRTSVEVVKVSADFAEYSLYLGVERIHQLAQNKKSAVHTWLTQHPCCRLDAESSYLLSKHLELLSSYLKTPERPHFFQSSLWFLVDSFQLKCYELLYKIGISQLPEVEDKQQLTADLTLFERFFNILYQHHRQERQVDYYIEQLGSKPEEFSAAIQRFSGAGPKFWITSVTLRFIKALLLETEFTTKEIASRYHFSSPSAFCSFFKKNTGIPPLSFRKEYATLI